MNGIGLIFFLAGLAVAVTIVQLLLKQAGREEYGLLALLTGLMIALLKILPLISELFEEVESVIHWLR